MEVPCYLQNSGEVLIKIQWSSVTKNDGAIWFGVDIRRVVIIVPGFSVLRGVQFRMQSSICTYPAVGHRQLLTFRVSGGDKAPWVAAE